MTDQSSGPSESAVNEFLHKEYELCFEQLRFYDERQSNLLKFLFTLTSAVATAQFALYKALQQNLWVNFGSGRSPSV
jgi:hypothetical protein